MSDTIPVGLCQCGCGGAAPIATRSNTAFGHVKGQPMRFIMGHQHHRQESFDVRFWARVTKSPEPDGCWLWSGAIFTATGYGSVTVNSRPASAHRIAWTLTHGAIPGGLNVLHRCDNPPCVRPDHLF